MRHGVERIRIVLDYLKQRFDEHLELVPIFVDALSFYPQFSIKQQMEIFQYLERQDFLELKIEHAYADEDGYFDFNDKIWVDKLKTYGKHDFHPPRDGEKEFEIVQNSYIFRITWAKDFDQKYAHFKMIDSNPYEIVYQLRIRKKDCQFFLCVNDHIICKLQERKLPLKVFPRLLKSGNSCWVKVGDLFLQESQSPSQLLNSAMRSPELRKVFFPETTKNTIFVRSIITVDDLYTHNIDRKNIEEIIETLPLF